MLSSSAVKLCSYYFSDNVSNDINVTGMPNAIEYHKEQKPYGKCNFSTSLSYSKFYDEEQNELS